MAGPSAVLAGGLAGPRPHHDLDLLYPAEDFTAVDALMADGWGLAEITAKRLAHKRAFVRHGVMAELILVRAAGRSFVTRFRDEVTYTWPDDLLTGHAAGLRVASRSAIMRYRADHARIHGHGSS
jgi:hypothetical protein